MNRNTESHFAYLPHVSVPRSRFDRKHTYKTTFNAGRLIPFLAEEVLPGDTFKIDTSFAIRMATPIFPVMDDLYCDVYYFFVPNRLVWEHWEEFNGQPEPNAWTDPTEYNIPILGGVQNSNQSGGMVLTGSLADYFGLPVSSAITGTTNIKYSAASDGQEKAFINALPFRAYELIWNEDFRDQNLQDPVNINLSDSYDPIQYGNGIGAYTDLYLQEWSVNVFPGTTEPAPVAKYHDYFTSALPLPQKGEPVELPLATTGYPGTTADVNFSGSANVSVFGQSDGSTTNVNVQTKNGGALGAVNGLQYTDTGGVHDIQMTVPGSGFTGSVTIPSASIEIQAVTISNLRQAFQLQKFLEKDARFGTRYTEMLRGHFGVTSPDSRLQRPEYLGGGRFPISMVQVPQTSATDSTSPQGNMAGYSFTIGQQSGFTRSFTEHGWIIGVLAIRQNHSYSQGVEKQFLRRTRYDYYWPVFANISEQPILNGEIFYRGDSSDLEVFGYQEAWADYRYKPSRVTGLFRPAVPNSLSAWTYTDNYVSRPFLSDQWIREDMTNINRTLAVPSNDKAIPVQFICDICIDEKATRPMPVYSIPGLVDHH